MDSVITIGSFELEVWRIGAALLAVFSGLVLNRIARLVLKKLKVFQEKTKTRWDDVLIHAIDRPIRVGLTWAGVGIALLVLPFPEEPLDIHHFIEAVLKGLGAALAVWFSLRLIDGVMQELTRMAEGTESKLDDQVLPIIRTTLKVVAVIIGAMLVIQNLGYSIGSLLAGLGLGGAAIALASKDTVANLFGSLVIFIDRPFQIGDWVKIGSIEGTVEEVGLRTTRIRTFANSLITLPNHTLTTSAIENWSQMQKRRISMTVGVTYDSKPEQLEELVEAFREVIRNDENLKQDFFLVNFQNFGASSLDIFIYCFTNTTVWAEYLDARQELLLKFMQEVESRGMSFAFPSQSLYVETVPDALTSAFGAAPKQQDLPS